LKIIFDITTNQYFYKVFLGGLWCLTPLSTIFQLFCDGQFYWWGNTAHQEFFMDGLTELLL
jgi:hypothetical protein